MFLVKNMNKAIETKIGKIEPQKTTVYFAKFVDKGEVRIYGFAIFDKVVYVKVRVGQRLRSKDKNTFTWLLEPTVEAVGLSLSEVTKND